MTLEPCEFVKISARDFKKMKQVIDSISSCTYTVSFKLYISNLFDSSSAVKAYKKSLHCKPERIHTNKKALYDVYFNI